MDFAAEFLDQNRLFSELIASGDPATPVPTCPGWTLKQLFRHVGGGNRWAGQIVSDRMQEALAFDAVRDARAPANLTEAIDWLDAGARALVDAVAADPDAQVWTFTGPQPARWWLRRRLHEVVVHCADAAIALGAPFDPYPALAADAISELFGLVLTRMPDLGGKSIHLHATDDGLGAAGEWTIASGALTQSHDKADLALRGPATDLLLVTTRRRQVGDTAVEVFGDQALLQTWLDGMKF